MLVGMIEVEWSRDMNSRERVRRAYDFTGPDRVPLEMRILMGTWHKYRDELKRIVERHSADGGQGATGPETGDYDVMPAGWSAGEEVTDSWGCVWQNIHGGLLGRLKSSPIRDWHDLDRLKAPDPLEVGEFGPVDWAKTAAQVERDRGTDFVYGSGSRLFERMHFLRGYEPLLIDIAERNPGVWRLRDLIVDNNLRLIRRWLDLPVDCIGFGDDWGTQSALMIRPAAWREIFKPAYARMFEPIRKAGLHVHFHSDGYILDIIPDLIEIGLTGLNPQSLVNGLDPLAALFRGRICLRIDLDRQGILPFGSPGDVKEHVREVILRLGSPEGGLIVAANIGPDVPLANIEAIYQAMDLYAPI
jgi:hypothetical protein